ncbi:Cys-tRNA(Pro) deacylase [Nakamurella flava]|uniref:Cys-tRNA(Pro)/Cys-tRNA(Cys) deacylase n=1 Tax=Nakamurella flava TaxID=2576308 RepID=A0A4U6QM67_9ACTN|nr:Cys-tRNA(Pro) deacylase [Nakamurella flava]TKV61491.1 Cys-tRNA(Pro) deacylase [Nakamurella flava]
MSGRSRSSSPNRGGAGGTPAVTALTRLGIDHTLLPYHHDPASTAFGDEAVAALGRTPDEVFKTLVAELDGKLVVGVVPVSHQLDLKALAAALGGKKAVMAKVADAERSSGYVAGGISPLGQKRALPTVVDATAMDHERVLVSAGRRGLQVELAPADLIRAMNATVSRISAA